MSKNTDLGSLVNYVKGQVTGRLNAPAYTSATAFTGTIAGYLGFDTSGNILTTSAIISGSGTTNYIPKFTGSTSLGNSLIFDNGTNVFVNATSGGYNTPRLLINSGSGVSIGLQVISDADGRLLRFMTPDFNNSNTGSDIRMGFGAGSGNTYFNMQVYTAGETASGNLILQPSYGFVGIGTVTPNTLLTTNQTGSTGYFYSGQQSGTEIAYWYYNASEIQFSSKAATRSLLFLTTNVERMRITAAGEININTSTTGYTLNAITSVSTQFNAVYKGSGSLVQIMARFMGDTTSNLGIAIGYSSPTYGTSSGIWSTQEGTLKLGVKDGIFYKTKIQMDSTNVYLDIPTSSAGLSSGAIWNDGGTVKITT